MDALRIRRRIEGIGRIGETGGIGKSNYLRCLETFQQGVRGSSRNEQPSEPGPQGGVGEGKSKYLRCLEAFQQGVRRSSRNEQSSEPGPWGGVGEGKSKYLGCLEAFHRGCEVVRGTNNRASRGHEEG